MREEWKAVAGFEGAYEVSDLGRVRSLPRVKTITVYDVLTKARVSRVVNARRTVHVMTPKVNSRGYLEVCLRADGRKGGKQRMAYVQRLVCETFLGPAPAESFQAHHKNGDRTDNRLANLEWSTPWENNRAKPDRKIDRSKWRRSLTPEKKTAAGILLSAGMELSAVARCLSLSRRTLASLTR